MLNKKQIKKILVVHHSHTDIGYTDLQERVVYSHINNIQQAVDLIKKGYEENTVDKNFKWVCETYYCVQEYLEQASASQKADFFDLVKKGNIGISATYLNMNDLVDTTVLSKWAGKMVDTFKEAGITIKCAMNADVNGITMGARDAFIDNGVEFLFTNIHTHHGMYPLYHNQTAYYWENDEGKRLLVFSGEHYNLGNALGLVHNKNLNFMTQTYFGEQKPLSPTQILKANLDEYVNLCLDHDYPYDFIVTSVSGVFSDNAPPNPDILYRINEFNDAYGDDYQIEMVTLDQLYQSIKPQIENSPVYKGDLNDWWANGVGSTPYAVKHYKEAQRLYHLCGKLDRNAYSKYEKYAAVAEENMLLYAEHTWGHSSTITNPYDTMVQNLDIRNTSYASKAHEAAAAMLNRINHELGDKLSYYAYDGKIKAINPNDTAGVFPVEFYIETMTLPDVAVTHDGKAFETQLSSHPRGVLISFVDTFAPHEAKTYEYKTIKKETFPTNTRDAYMGAERVRDIINDYDKLSYTLPYKIENDYFVISYEIGKGITSFFNKATKTEMLTDAKFFTPIYENTEIRTDVYEERRKLGRNIRGLHAKQFVGELSDIKIIEVGKIFKTIELIFKLEGTFHSSVVIKLYNSLPKIDFKYKIAKTLSVDVESVYLPLSLSTDDEMYFSKGDRIMRPGIDQLPGTGMEYYCIDDGIVYQGKKGSIIINTWDTPLIYMGELKHHEIKLCDNDAQNNHRTCYSWIMNNTWETNFKMDLSGCDEFCYSLCLTDNADIKGSMNALKSNSDGIITFIQD